MRTRFPSPTTIALRTAAGWLASHRVAAYQRLTGGHPRRRRRWLRLASALTLAGLTAFGVPLQLWADGPGAHPPAVIVEEEEETAQPTTAQPTVPVLRGRPDWHKRAAVRTELEAAPAAAPPTKSTGHRISTSIRGHAAPATLAAPVATTEPRTTAGPALASSPAPATLAPVLPSPRRAEPATRFTPPGYGSIPSSVAPVTVDLGDSSEPAQPAVANVVADADATSLLPVETNTPEPSRIRTRTTISGTAAAVTATPLPRVGPFVPGLDGRLERRAVARTRLAIASHPNTPADDQLTTLAAAIADSLAPPATESPLVAPAAPALVASQLEPSQLEPGQLEPGILAPETTSGLVSPPINAAPLERFIQPGVAATLPGEESQSQPEAAAPLRARPSLTALAQENQPEAAVSPSDQATAEPIDEDFKPLSSLRADIRASGNEFPKDLAKERFDKESTEWHVMGHSRFGIETEFNWEAVALCHRPLLFEEVNLERHGFRVPWVQPALSGAHFFGRVPAIPYLMVAEKYRSCNYTLGHYRPGSWAPYVWYYPRFSLDGATFETLLIAGLIYVIP